MRVCWFRLPRLAQPSSSSRRDLIKWGGRCARGRGWRLCLSGLLLPHGACCDAPWRCRPFYNRGRDWSITWPGSHHNVLGLKFINNYNKLTKGYNRVWNHLYQWKIHGQSFSLALEKSNCIVTFDIYSMNIFKVYSKGENTYREFKQSQKGIYYLDMTDKSMVFGINAAEK